MLKLISPKKASKILAGYDGWIRTVSQRYGVPENVIKAVLYQEMTMIDLLDPLADLAVLAGIPSKRDSSTGFGQVFGYVGLDAVNFAVDRHLTTYRQLGIHTAHRLSRENPSDVRLVWKKLFANPKANIEITALNLLAAADEVIGRTDFPSFTDEELKLVLTRYNADVRFVTQYGERAYRLVQELGESGSFACAAMPATGDSTVFPVAAVATIATLAACAMALSRRLGRR